jgi:hypothetical protein
MTDSNLHGVAYRLARDELRDAFPCGLCGRDYEHTSDCERIKARAANIYRELTAPRRKEKT